VPLELDFPPITSPRIGYEFLFGDSGVIAPKVDLGMIEGHKNEKVYGIAIGKLF